MLTIRRSSDRGVANYRWLNSHHTFSFGEYFDPQQMGFGDLRVINEDRVIGGEGFPTHSHRDMEIISYVLAGALEHNDTLGNGSVIRPGDVQRMSAGRGISHSEYNHSATADVHFLQIWIMPHQRGLPPSYEQKHFAPAQKQNCWRLVGSADGRDGSVLIHQDVALSVAALAAQTELTYSLAPKRQAWLQVTQGQVDLNGQALAVGDGAAIVALDTIHLTGRSDQAEVLLFDLVRSNGHSWL